MPTPPPLEWVDQSRVIFEAEDPAKGPYHRYDPATRTWVERDAITKDFLTTVAANSDPKSGRIANELGVKDFDPAGVIGHEEVDGALVSSGMPRAARTRAFRAEAGGQRLVWDYQVPKPLAPFLHPESGALPRVSASFYPDFAVDGGRRVGPAVRHVAFLGATPPVKRNLLGLWNPDLYVNNSEPAPDAIRFAEGATLIVRYAEGDPMVDPMAPAAPAAMAPAVVAALKQALNVPSSVEVTPDQLRERLAEAAEAQAEAAMAEMVQDIAKAAGVDPAPLLAWAQGVDPAAPVDAEAETTDEEMDMSEPTKTAKPAVSPKDFAETQALLARQGKTLETLRAENEALKATVAKREREHGEAEVVSFAERLADKYPGPTRQAAILAALRKARGYLDFAEGESRDPAAALFAVLDAVGESHRTNGAPVSAGARGIPGAGTIEATHVEYSEAVAQHGLTTSFRQFAEADGFQRAEITTFATAKGFDAEAAPAGPDRSPMVKAKRK